MLKSHVGHMSTAGKPPSPHQPMCPPRAYLKGHCRGLAVNQVNILPLEQDI